MVVALLLGGIRGKKNEAEVCTNCRPLDVQGNPQARCFQRNKKESSRRAARCSQEVIKINARGTCIYKIKVRLISRNSKRRHLKRSNSSERRVLSANLRSRL